MTVSRRLALGLTGALFAAGGLGAGLGLAGETPTPTPTSAASSALTGTSTTPPTWMTGYAGYTGMMNRYGGPTAATGNGNGNGNGAWPGGMMGGGYGMYSGTNMGAIMGRVLANTAGPRVSTAQAAADATAIPPGATLDVAHNRLTFTGNAVALTLVAGADEANMYTFQAAGLTNPQIVVPAGARVALRLVNADTDMAHGIVLTATGAADTSWMPMMTSTVAFPGAAIWVLGEADSSGAPTATTSFTTTPGTYTYLCPVPGHTQQGMYGALTVR